MIQFIDNILSGYIINLLSGNDSIKELDSIYNDNEQTVDDFLYFINLIDDNPIFKKNHNSSESLFEKYNSMIKANTFTDVIEFGGYKCFYENKIWIDIASLYYSNNKMYKTSYAFNILKFGRYKKYGEEIIRKKLFADINYKEEYSLRKLARFYFWDYYNENVFANKYIDKVNSENNQFRHTINISEFLLSKENSLNYDIESMIDYSWVKLLYDNNNPSRRKSYFNDSVILYYKSDRKVVEYDNNLDNAMYSIYKYIKEDKSSLIENYLKPLFEEKYNV